MSYSLFSAESDLPARVARSSCRKHRLMVPMTKSSFSRGIKKLGYPYKLVYKYVKFDVLRLYSNLYYSGIS